MEHNSVLQTVVKRSVIIGAILVLIFSIHFSYDGFDQTIGNGGKTFWALIVGYGIALVFTLVQFVFNSGFGKLNLTLIVAGIFAYVYSIYTNYMGITNILGVSDPVVAGVLSAAMDILPESLLAWALGDSLKGDLFGNMVKSVGLGLGMIFGVVPTQSHKRQGDTQPNKPYVPQHRPSQPAFQSKKGKGRQYHEEHRVSTKPNGGFQSFMKDLEDDGARPAKKYFE